MESLSNLTLILDTPSPWMPSNVRLKKNVYYEVKCLDPFYYNKFPTVGKVKKKGVFACFVGLFFFNIFETEIFSAFGEGFVLSYHWVKGAREVGTNTGALGILGEKSPVHNITTHSPRNQSFLWEQSRSVRHPLVSLGDTSASLKNTIYKPLFT